MHDVCHYDTPIMSDWYDHRHSPAPLSVSKLSFVRLSVGPSPAVIAVRACRSFGFNTLMRNKGKLRKAGDEVEDCGRQFHLSLTLGDCKGNLTEKSRL